MQLSGTRGGTRARAAPCLILAANFARGFARTDRFELCIAGQLQSATSVQHIHVAFKCSRIGAIDADQLALAGAVIAAGIVLCGNRGQGIAASNCVGAAGSTSTTIMSRSTGGRRTRTGC